MRTLAVAMDVADARLVFEWVSEGRLPTLGSLLGRGAAVRLDSDHRLGPEAVWPAIITGCSAGKHGTYNWRSIRPGTNLRVRTPSRTYRRPFWWALRNGGTLRRVLLLDVPYTSRLEDDGVIEVLGWGQRGAPRHESWPDDLLARVTAKHGGYARGLDREHEGNPSAIAARLRGLKQMSATRTRLLAELMQGGEWDLALAAYSEPHYGGHHFHRYLDPRSWGYDPRTAARFGGALLELYQEVDRGIGELLDLAGPGTNVLVFSGLGMRPNTNGVAALEQVMFRLGYQVPNRPSGRSRGLERLRQAALRWVPRTLASRLKARLFKTTEERHFERLWEESTDWKRTRAFVEGEPGHSFIRITRPHGRDYRQLQEEIATELLALEDADSGRPAVEEVARRDEFVDGPHADALPELCIVWSEGGMVRRLRHPRVGVIEEDVSDVKASEHRHEGFLIAAGPLVRNRADVLDGHVVDLAPTLLHLMGGEIPEEMDGAPLTELLDPRLGEPRREAIDMRDDPWQGR